MEESFFNLFFKDVRGSNSKGSMPEITFSDTLKVAKKWEMELAILGI